MLLCELNVMFEELIYSLSMKKVLDCYCILEHFP